METIGRSRKLLFTLMTLMLSVVFVLVAAEVMVRVMVPEETFWPVSNIYQASEVPGLIYTYRPDFEGVAFGVDLRTNRLGFRGPQWSDEKKPGSLRIALVGDSHAFGFGVPSSQIMPTVLSELLQERLKRPVEVLNFGVNGYNSLQQQAALEHLALSYGPDMVILLPASNDHQPPLRADGEGWLHWDGEGSNERSRMVDKSIDEVKVDEVSWWMEKSRLFLYLKLWQKRRQFAGQTQAERQASAEHSTLSGEKWMGDFPPGPVVDRLRETVYQPMGEMLNLLQERQVPVIVASFFGPTDYRQMLQVLEQEHGVVVLELLTLFPETSSWEDLTHRFGLGWDDHLNAAAHRRWAVALADLIVEQGFDQPKTVAEPGT